MTLDPDIGRMTVGALLAAISSDEPAPGAGAAAAVTLALGLACARKALRISRKHHPEDGLLEALDVQLAATVRTALVHGQLDAERFAALIEARQMPHSKEHEAAARTAAVERAGAALSLNTRQLLEICNDGLAQIDSATGHVDKVMTGDFVAARMLIGAARAITAENFAESELS